jgi:hypothetical protein
MLPALGEYDREDSEDQTHRDNQANRDRRDRADDPSVFGPEVDDHRLATSAGRSSNVRLSLTSVTVDLLAARPNCRSALADRARCVDR